MLIPIAFKNAYPIDQPLVLGADLGGTKTNMALFQHTAQGPELIRQAHFSSRQFPSFADMVRSFLKGGAEKPRRICIGVAGPVVNGKAKLTNLTWELDAESLKKELNLEAVFMINDLEATAYGLAALKNEQLQRLSAATTHVPGNIALIAPGTGLGEAGLFWDGAHYHPFATEGGHAGFGPRDEEDVEVYQFLRMELKRVSWERLVSGQGIMNIFRYLSEYKKLPVSGTLRQAIAQDGAAALSYAALEKSEEVAVRTLELFVKYLATESANLVLKFKATSLFIGGGIPPAILPLLKGEEWQNYFTDNGRMKPLLDEVPAFVVLEDKCALLGAGWYALYNM